MLLTLAAVAALALLVVLGRSILVQNAKPEQAAVPYLINQTEEQARALLSARRLLINATNVTNATVAPSAGASTAQVGADSPATAVTSAEARPR